MYQILNFISNNKSFLLFLLLELISFGLIINTHSFHQSKLMAFSQFYSGNVQKTSDDITGYFKLKKVNKTLADENTALKSTLEQFKHHSSDTLQTTGVSFDFLQAKIINNTFLKSNNYLTLNKGSNDGLKPDMGVITSNGLIGIVIQTSKHFSKVMSLLNSNASFNVKFNHSNHFGSLKWDGKDFKIAQLYDIPLQADIQIGDSISSGSQSLFFPENIPVGVVKDFSIDNKMYQKIDIELFVDFSNLNYVYVVQNNDKDELQALEQNSIE